MPEHSAGHTRERIDNAPVSDLLRRYPDLLEARAAMKRAAEAARKLAEQTGAELVVGESRRERVCLTWGRLSTVSGWEMAESSCIGKVYFI